MKTSLLGPLLLLAFSSTIASGLGLSKSFKTFSFGQTWEEAQHFCQSYYTDLATIENWSEAASIDFRNFLGWIGVYKKWWWHPRQRSEGQDHFDYDWGEKEPRRWGSCGAVKFSDKKLFASECGGYRMFVCEIGSAYKFVGETKTWYEALDYCRQHNGNLARLRRTEMDDVFTDLDFPLWIGFNRKGGTFTWSSGLSAYSNWTTGEPSSGNCVTISSLTKQMATNSCDDRLPFVCMWDGNANVLVVRENKSWEEALQHCRGLSENGLRFDLVSVQPGDEHQYMMSKAMQANTEEVWIGLRFLGDEWLWMNGADMLSTSLPLCPSQQQRCGVLSKNDTGSVEVRDCAETKNFLCYSFTP